MYSNEGELVPFKKEVKARGQVETWLESLQTAMRDTLYKCMKEGYQLLTGDKPPKREDFVMNNNHFGQIVATTAQIMWTAGTEDAIQNMPSYGLALDDWLKTNIDQLEVLTAKVRGELSDLKRRAIVALITVDVHARDIVDELNQNKTESTNDFKWMKQLKYYWEEEGIDDIRIRQVSATLPYGYEFMGPTSRLVITPLTDKCWITITNALHIKLGANPAGPAGTGKTESTKDLAKAIAI